MRDCLARRLRWLRGRWLDGVCCRQPRRIMHSSMHVVGEHDDLLRVCSGYVHVYVVLSMVSRQFDVSVFMFSYKPKHK